MVDDSENIGGPYLTVENSGMMGRLLSVKDAQLPAKVPKKVFKKLVEVPDGNMRVAPKLQLLVVVIGFLGDGEHLLEQMAERAVFWPMI